MKLSASLLKRSLTELESLGHCQLENVVSIKEVELVRKISLRRLKQIRNLDLKMGKPRERAKRRLDSVVLPSFKVLKDVDQEYIINSSLYDNDALHQVLTELFGTSDYYNPILEVTFNHPGTKNQHIHRDFSAILPKSKQSLPTLAICVAVPLIDTNSENGTIQQWPRTHKLIDSKLGFYDDLSGRVKSFASERPELLVSNIHIRDSRLIHRGMANKSDVIRPWLSSIWIHPLIRFDNKMELNQKTWSSISKRSKHVLRFAEIRESLKCPTPK